MTAPRFFVHLHAESPEEAREQAGRHGDVLALRLTPASAAGVYGTAEIAPEPAEKEPEK
jgi:hypothetical protein